ncbi:hypothetical protein THMIRHAS_12180 [Thiosulfatimonas sediminis]|uniref:Uncharacterized protein n=1 Tax=Thiosulfatimonas sediminis TaxID=2675054 RepID=A0A6F8PUP6_9GAMM|nr:hypothetical protein THMIRHAS_12180 [Thiosulfatimonas sediminis]
MSKGTPTKFSRSIATKLTNEKRQTRLNFIKTEFMTRFCMEYVESDIVPIDGIRYS